MGRIATLVLAAMLGAAVTLAAPAASPTFQPLSLKHSGAKAASKQASAPKPIAALVYYGRVRRQGLLRAPDVPNQLKSSPVGNYLAQTEGISRWPYPCRIKVYVAPGRPEFKAMVASCFGQWSHACSGRIHFNMVDSPSRANYVIGWTRHQKEVRQGTEAGLTTTDTYVDDSGHEFIERARTNILTRYEGKPLSDREIAETCLHEIGHGLGIEGHSSNAADIMYYAVSPRQCGHLTARDCNTISRLYAI